MYTHTRTFGHFWTIINLLLSVAYTRQIPIFYFFCRGFTVTVRYLFYSPKNIYSPAEMELRNVVACVIHLHEYFPQSEVYTTSQYIAVYLPLPLSPSLSVDCA